MFPCSTVLLCVAWFNICVFFLLVWQRPKYKDMRGSYDRNAEGVSKRLSLAQMAWNHRQAIENGDLRICHPNCKLGARCFKGLSENDLLQCHEHSFGTSLQWDMRKGQPTLDRSTSETQQAWRSVMSPIFVFDMNNMLVHNLVFTVANMNVCEECMRLSYGIPSSTWKLYMRMGKTGPRALDLHGASKELERAERAEEAQDRTVGTKRSDALIWWLDWLHW